MNRSKIGYSIDGEPVYYAWNPFGMGCSAGCPGCWAKALSRRLAKAGCPQCLAFMPHMHPERLCQPSRRKKPSLILGNFTADTADAARPFRELRQLWDTMFECPQHQFVLLTHQYERMARWLVGHASRLDFGWTTWDRTPVRCGGYTHYDDMMMREKCGWMRDYGDSEYRDWGCWHPDGDGDCSSYGCPVASAVDSQEQLTEIGVANDYEFDSEGYANDCQWMQWYARPRRGACDNVWIGFTARDQAELDRAFAATHRIKGANPHAKLWLSLEPLVSAVTGQRSMYLGHAWDEGVPVVNWFAQTYDMPRGGEEHASPYIQGVIVGHDNRRGAPGTDTLEHIRSTVEQCDAVGVPRLVKQIWVGLPGERRYRLLHASKPAEYALYPEWARNNALPWATNEED